MWKFKNILAVMDPAADEQKALNRACHLASLNRSAVTAFLCIYDFSYEMTTMLSADERGAMRNAVIEDRTGWVEDEIQRWKEKGVEVQVKVVWHNRPYESIINEVLTQHYDVIIKGTHQHDKLKSVIFTPTDWHLLRKSPVPVLLVKDHDWPEDGNILGAINAGTEDEAHVSLNHEVTKHAQFLAEVIHAKTNLVNSYPATPVNIAIEIPEFDPDVYNENVKQHHFNALSAHGLAYSISGEYLHLGEGLPEDIIPKVAEEIDAELVILGTVGRTGISAALIGNTAEHVIDQLNCDVLAIKPEGFECPIKV